MIRLQHENKMLKLKQGETADEKSELLQSLLDDANARKNELESENRYLFSDDMIIVMWKYKCIIFTCMVWEL